jgi:type III restriction enzyme
LKLDFAPDLTGLDAEAAARVKVEPRPDGTVTISVHGEISEDLEQRLVAAVTTPERQAAIRTAVHRHRIIHRNSISPAERGEKFTVPRLFLNVQGKLEFAEKELILDLGGWTLNNYAAELTPTEFSISETAERWEVDLQGEKVVYKHLDQSVQLDLGLLRLDWTDLRFKYQLAKAVQQKIATYRQQAYDAGYQSFLFSPQAQVETSFADGFAFEKSRPYPAPWFYQGAYQFKKHFFGPVGELSSKGEEFECAKLIDNLPQIKHWVRNLASQLETSFWLPTSTGRFYPDFVAQLNDDRIFVIEYKGSYLVDTQDTKGKRNIGELWAAKSGDKGLFLMAEKQSSQRQALMDQITALLR